MRFLADECTGPGVARWLRDQHHEVFSVYNDKDFGEKIYRERHPHRGVVLLRLTNDRTGNKITAIRRLLQDYADQLIDRYVVVTETKVRFAHK
jgi:predicted nuclease of predicted toxin-antitoxin system